MLQRLKKRVEEGKSVNVHTPEDHQIRYDLYIKNRKNDAITYNTDNLSTEELYTRVIKDLNI